MSLLSILFSVPMRLSLVLAGILFAAWYVPIAPAQDAPDSVAVDSVVVDSLAVGVAPGDGLEDRIRSVFAVIDDFQDVAVTARNGVVRLRGTVPGSDAYDRAAALAGRFDGVLYVDNQLRASTDVETRVSPALERVQSYWDGAVAGLPVFGVAVVLLLLFWLLARFVAQWEAPFERMGMSPLVHGLLRRSLGAVLFGIGLVLALDVLDVTALVGAVLGTAGVVGLALGFAFQDIVENYLAGVLMSVRQPFAVNDLVDVGEHQGKVIRMTSRELVLMTVAGNHLRLPNATVFKSPITNYTRNPRRRFGFTVGVANEADLVQVQELGVDTLRAMKGVMKDPAPLARVEALGDSNVAVQFFGWVDQRSADFGKVRSEAIRLVKTAFDEAGVEMPEPIYRVHLRERSTPVEPSPSPLPSAAAQADAIDVSPDTELDEQVQEDLAASDEENLLAE